MSTSYTAQEFVSLPVLNARSTAVVMTELFTAADAQSQQLAREDQCLPTSISRALGRMRSCYSALEAVLLPYLPATDPQDAREADLKLDRAWSALNDLLAAWGKLEAPFNPDPDGVAALKKLLFVDGLSFILVDYKSQWQESDSRLTALNTSVYQETLSRLGGMPLLENLRQAQDRYGLTLGITQVKVPENTPAVGEKRVDAHAALRDYVTKVVAWIDPEEPGSEALADALLAPLVAWESKQSGSSDSSGANGASTASSPAEAQASAASSAPA